jgi:hypothetical protein
MTGTGDVVAFKQIGHGLPLHVAIDRVYTGRYPKGGLFRGADIALISGVKDYSVLSASTRALNLLIKDVEQHSHIQVSAFHEGTPLILYSPAVMSDSLILTVEIAVGSFDDGFFELVRNGLTAAAGVPLMLPYAGFLVAAGEVVKLASGLADALFDGGPAFSITESLNFGLPGRPRAVADHWLLTHRTDLTGYRYDPGLGLIDPDGSVYRGDDPYVVLTLDGAPRPELEGFAAKAASTAVLERFFGIKERTGTSVDTLVEGLQLVSDFRLRKQADQLTRQIDEAEDSDLRSKLIGKRSALIKNIGSEMLRPA